MSEIQDKINQILSNPEALKQVQSLGEQLGLANDDDCYTWDEFLEIGKGMSSKLGKICFYNLGTLDEIDGVISDSEKFEMPQA